MADMMAMMIVLRVSTTIESNYGITGNGVLWERYLKEHRQTTLEFLNKEVPDEKIRWLLVFTAGLVCGLMLANGWGVLQGRAGSTLGGEVLLIPLIALFVWMGY